MKNLLLLVLLITFYSCGIVNDTNDETFTYTYILKNETGTTLEITGDFDERTELIEDGNNFVCSYDASNSDIGGLCSGFIEIKIPATNKGYRCYGLINQVEGLCLVEDERLFTTLEGTVFTETSTRVYEYVLTPEILDNVFELPD